MRLYRELTRRLSGPCALQLTAEDFGCDSAGASGGRLRTRGLLWRCGRRGRSRRRSRRRELSARFAVGARRDEGEHDDEDEANPEECEPAGRRRFARARLVRGRALVDVVVVAVAVAVGGASVGMVAHRARVILRSFSRVKGSRLGLRRPQIASGSRFDRRTFEPLY